jgi:hypothetical protein
MAHLEAGTSPATAHGVGCRCDGKFRWDDGISRPHVGEGASLCPRAEA